MNVSKTIRLALLLQGCMLCLHQGLYSQVVINEVMASNASSTNGIVSNDDWIELYNSTTSAIDLGGYSFSDDKDNPFLWKFPSGSVIAARGYLMVYADDLNEGLHTNFKLSKDGEKLLLANKQGYILDTFEFPYQLTNVSYGRKRNEAAVTGYFTLPTPGAANDLTIATGISPAPVFSVAGGFHSGAQSVEIATPSPGARIFYTLDGTEPTMSSTPYSGPLSMTKTSVLRVRTFVDGFLPGAIVTQSYFIDEPVNLPVISLVTDPDHFFSDETGIYVEGTAGVAGYCTSVPHNVNQDWERPVNIELYEKDGTPGLNQVAGVKIFGGCSRVRFPMKSLAFYARKEYETASFNYKLFPDKKSEEYETFILRASGDDQPSTMFRDALTQMVVKDVIDVDVQAYRPVVLYINGEYWGIHNMREKINEHYANDNFDANPDSVDVLKRNPANSWDVVHGNADHYNAMIDYLKTNDITQPSHYEYICSQMDKDEYINYQITQIFFGGQDWPGNNIKFWRSREKPYDRWRWVLYDLDHTFADPYSNIMEEATEVDCGCTWPNPSWSTYLFRRMLENKSFREEFIQRFFLYAGSHFSRERIHGIINKLQAVIAPEIPRHIERWGGQKTSLPDNTWVSPIFTSVGQWEWNVQVMRNFTDVRHEMAIKQVMDYFGLSDLSGLTASVEPARQGSIVAAHSVITNSSVSADIHTGEQLLLSCKPEPGYVLSHWKVIPGTERDSTLISRGDSWKYLESWATPASNWTSLNYNDENWNTGNAQFGYGDGDEATVIGYGGDAQNKMITSWFRKTFTIADLSAFTRYTLHLLRDDGSRVFVNGAEVIRENMDKWSYGSYSPAVVSINGADEKYFQTYQINPALFKQGRNVIAVEIHQASASSSDMSFDMDLQATGFKAATPVIYHQPDLSLAMSSGMHITAVMAPDTAAIEKIFINEVMARNTSGLTDEAGEHEDWIELYNGGSSPVDLAGLYFADALPPVEIWPIPTGNPELTTILPNGYKLFIADGEASGNQLHTGFKLSKDGDQVALLKISGKDTIVIDHLEFGAQQENVSWGSYPNGSGLFRLMSQSTPGEANVPVTKADDITNSYLPEKGISIYPVPTKGQLFVKLHNRLLKENLPVQIFIWSNTGRLVSHGSYPASEIIELSLSHQPAGIYLVRVIAGKEVFDKKVVVN
ncbi:MAG TPA: CotH kinase family protein [Prolixibacteraceae bacterium]|nr:CotH kinase family protein [Prolixibacteraceae bacterium]